MSASRVAWVIATTDVIVYLVTSLHPSDGGVAATLLFLAGIATFAGVGALLTTRVPGNPIGPLLLAAGTVLVASITVGTYAEVGAQQAPAWPGTGAARLIGDTTFIYPFVIAFIGVPLVFPDGRLLSRRYRWVVAVAIGYMAVWTYMGLLYDAETGARIPALAFLDPFADLFETFVLFATLFTFGAAGFATWTRFRRGDGVQRQQIKWLTADVALAVLCILPGLILTDVNPGLADAFSSAAVLSMLALPIVIAIAILRYRLFEIDRIVSRTIGWAIVTALLVAVFAGLVVLLQAVLAPVVRENTLAIAASTLIAFALFQPLRRRVQRAVDRRFDRSRYDGQRLADSFAEGLRNEVDLGVLRASLAATAGEAVRPTRAAVWLSSRRAR